MVTMLSQGAVRTTFSLPIRKLHGSMEVEALQEEADNELVRRRMYLASIYHALPDYGSTAFWRVVEEPDLTVALPLEVLTRCVRAAITRGDNAGRNRVIEVIIRRNQTSNEYWVRHALARLDVLPDERQTLEHDLYADLCESLIRALIDTKRLFWEEHFQHSLSFERKHVYQTYMRREGRWKSKSEHDPQRVTFARRIPRSLIESLDRPAPRPDGDRQETQMVDERAQQELLAVEYADIPRLILHLPEKLKAVIWLIFWESKTEKEAAGILNVSDRTIRNRLHDALRLLRNDPQLKKEAMYG